MTLSLRSSARSDVGLVRPGNEDSAYAGPSLLVVADGMGGYAAGELASATAVATLAELEVEGLGDNATVERLASSVSTTGERIADLVAASPEYAGMGTTLTALAWLGESTAGGGRVGLVHVGDSRAYLLRDGALAQITRDHTYVQTLVDAGRITAEEAAVHPRRNLLVRAIDGVHPVEPDVSVREARAGDRYLLCSDGLSGVLDDTRLLELLSIPDPTASVTALVDAALEAGAHDNVTCIVGDVVRTPDEATASTDAVVVGAAGEPATRDRLPDLQFPADAQPAPVADHLVVPIRTVGDPTAAGPAAVAQVYSEELERRTVSRSRKLLAAVVAVALLAVGVAVALFYGWTRSQWYVGVDGSNVAVYQGVPGSLLGVDLHGVDHVTSITVTSLPSFEASQVQATIYAESKDAAEATVARLQARADQCTTSPTTAGCPGAS